MNYEITIKDILARLESLEKRASPNISISNKPKEVKLSGPKGGVLLLVSKNFFNKKRTAIDTLQELEKHDYVYVISVVQTTLNRLSNKSGPLVSMKKAGKKFYARRK